MMAPRWHKVRRDGSVHLARTLLVAAAIAVAMTGAGTVLISWTIVRRATIEGYLASDPPAATLHLAQVDGRTLQIARTIPGVREVQARRVVSLPMQVRGTWRSAIIFAADDPADVRIGKLERAGGAWPPPLGTIAIERSSMTFAETGVGDTVVVIGPDSVRRVAAVSGIVRDVGLAPGWMEHIVYAWASTATLEHLGLPAAPDELQLVVHAPSPTRGEVRLVAGAVRAALDRAGQVVRDVDVPEPGEHIHAAQMDSMLMTQGAFGVLALVVAAFLVVNLMAAMLAGQAREVGIMKTLGATPRDLAAMYLAFATALGLLATGVALPAALVLGRRYAAMRGDMLNFDVQSFGAPWWAIALLVGTGVAIPVVAAWLPIRRAARSTVADALRDLGLTHDGDEAGEPWLARRGGGTRVFVLSLRNAFRRRQRMVLTMLTLASGGAVFVAAGNLRQSVIGSLDLIYGSQRFEFSVRVTAPQAPDTLEALVRAVAGVAAAEAWSGARAAAVVDGLAEEPFPLAGIPTGTQRLALDVLEGTGLPAGPERRLVVSRSLARTLPHARPGDELLLEVAGRREPWTIAGIFEGGPAPQAYTSAAALEVVRGDPRRSTVVVASAVKGPAATVDLVQRVRRALADGGIEVASTTVLAESRRVTEDHLLMVVQFLALMGWVMIAVGGMGLASTMGLAVLERTREIGVMRAIGARHGTIGLLIQLEGLVIATCGWALALPLSLPFSLILGEAFGRIMFRVPPVWSPTPASVGTWLGVVVGVSLVACAWPMRRAMRLPVSRVLAYD